jgi:UDP-glucose 4-epimerase
VLYRASVEDHPGVYNVTGPGIVILSQAIKLMGKLNAPVIPPYGGALATGVMRRFGVLDWPAHLLQLIQYGRVVDIGRLRDEFGYTPRFTSRETVEDFAAKSRVRGLLAEQNRYTYEKDLEEFLQRKGARGADADVVVPVP